MIALGGAAAWWWVGSDAPPGPTQTGAEPVAPPPDGGLAEAPAPDAGVEPASEPPPPVDPEADLRRIARDGSASEQLAGWLEAPGLFRRIAAAVHLVAMGRSPREPLAFMAPKGRFAVLESWDPEDRGRLPASARGEDRVYLDPESYRRYDPLREALRGADVEAWGRGYRRLAPAFERLYAEVAAPDERFEHALAEALRRVREVELPAGLIALEARGATFLYADPKLEGLDEVSKHLIRMGPKNAAAVQDAAARFARAAALPSVADAAGP